MYELKKNDKNILITGGTGFIGSSFLIYSSGRNKGIHKNFFSKKLQYRIVAPSHKSLDIYNYKQLKNIFSVFKPQIVINFAAHRNANSAELQRDNYDGSAWKTNVLGVQNLVKVCQEFDTYMIHISTDMVFSGHEKNPGPYHEDAKIEKNSENLSWYGWTKAEGERMVSRTKNNAIIRIGNVTQPIYDPQLDYVGKILYLFDKGSLYPLFHNQYLTVTYIYSLFEVIESLITNKKKGIFHVASTNIFTPYVLAKYLIKKTRGKDHLVKRVSIAKYLKKWPNRYPKYCGLLSEKTQKQLGLSFHDWRKIVDIYIEKLE